MIELFDWRTKTGDAISQDPPGKVYDVTFSSPEKYDDRSDWSTSYISRISRKVVEVAYSHETVSLELDGVQIPLSDFSSIDYTGKRILVDATALPLPEILHLFSIFDAAGQQFDVLYVQPMGYTKNEDEKVIDKADTFSLSDDGIGPQQIPPYVNYSVNASLLVCLGFEGHRFGALVHSDEYDTRNLIGLVGVPAFRSGWENTTLANNFKVMIDAEINAYPSYKIVGANDPVNTYQTISRVYKSATFQGRTLCLAPFGTKPTAVASALFAVNHRDVVVIYDFVRKRKKRSHGTDMVHLWRLRPA